MSRTFSSLPRRLATFVIFAAGLFFLLLGLGNHLQLLEARQLMAEGEKVEGNVTKAYSGGRRSTAYYYDYEYSAAESGLKLSGEKRSISFSHYEQLRPGTRIPVWHDAWNPERSMTTAEMAERENWANWLFLPVLGFGLLGWGIFRLFRRLPSPPAQPPADPAPRQTPPVRRGE